jgi:hypothetical protein
LNPPGDFDALLYSIATDLPITDELYRDAAIPTSQYTIMNSDSRATYHYGKVMRVVDMVDYLFGNDTVKGKL